MFFILVSLMLLASIDLYADEHKKYRGFFNEDIDHLGDRAGDIAKERIDQLGGHAKELKDQAFDQAELLQVMTRYQVDQARHGAIVDAAQNVTKMVFASSFGIGAVIAFYQAAKVAIAIACSQEQEEDKSQYITMYSCAGVAALCATCSALCYWCIN